MVKIIQSRVEVEREPLVSRPFRITRYDLNGNLVKKYNVMDFLSDSKNAIDRAEDYEIRKKAGNPNYMDSIKTWEFLEDVANSGNSELQNFICDSLGKYWLATTSIVEYNPKNQKDVTFHNWKTSDEYSLVGDIVGNDGWVKDINNSNALEFLVGTKDIEKLNEISNAINRTPIYLWRVHSKPSEKTEHVVRFDAGDVGLCLYADRYPSFEYPAFLVQ